MEPITNWETTDLFTGEDGTVTAPCYSPVVMMLWEKPMPLWNGRQWTPYRVLLLLLMGPTRCWVCLRILIGKNESTAPIINTWWKKEQRWVAEPLRLYWEVFCLLKNKKSKKKFVSSGRLWAAEYSCTNSSVKTGKKTSSLSMCRNATHLAPSDCSGFKNIFKKDDLCHARVLTLFMWVNSSFKIQQALFWVFSTFKKHFRDT